MENYDYPLDGLAPKCSREGCYNKVTLGTRGWWNKFCSKSCKARCSRSILNLKAGYVWTDEQRIAASNRCRESGQRFTRDSCIKDGIMSHKLNPRLKDNLTHHWSSDEVRLMHAKGVYLQDYIVESKRESMIKINSEGRSNKSKHYLVHGVKCLGSYEKWFIEELVNHNCKLPNKPESWILTPIGYYNPDFDFGDFFVEIKSSYTLSISETQLKKIDWVTKNLKEVRVLNLDVLDTFEKFYKHLN